MGLPNCGNRVAFGNGGCQIELSVCGHHGGWRKGGEGSEITVTPLNRIHMIVLLRPNHDMPGSKFRSMKLERLSAKFVRKDVQPSVYRDWMLQLWKPSTLILAGGARADLAAYGLTQEVDDLLIAHTMNNTCLEGGQIAKYLHLYWPQIHDPPARRIVHAFGALDLIQDSSHCLLAPPLGPIPPLNHRVLTADTPQRPKSPDGRKCSAACLQNSPSRQTRHYDGSRTRGFCVRAIPPAHYLGYYNLDDLHTHRQGGALSKHSPNSFTPTFFSVEAQEFSEDWGG
ncbi:hypothetical protein B0H17DRAFT_1251444 [Mycena rosella]|uniref:Uncharacterized protein n=1 Tax=Mycena rosella TaxID=1033263 RepID=A0AAD7GQ33_MYCRO|nr:hypothetical protein B0H17DRAFT_1251444 [Mycena rosella]